LPIAEFTYNNTLHSAHQQSPFFLNYSHHPWTGKETMSDTRNKSAKTFAEQMRSVREDAQAALLQNSEGMKNRHDKHAGVTREFSEGDLVYLEATNLKTTRAAKKLDDKRFGPFKVEKKVGPAAYSINSNCHQLGPPFTQSLTSHSLPCIAALSSLRTPTTCSCGGRRRGIRSRDHYRLQAKTRKGQILSTLERLSERGRNLGTSGQCCSCCRVSQLATLRS
jgi:hypothetical protein